MTALLSQSLPINSSNISILPQTYGELLRAMTALLQRSGSLSAYQESIWLLESELRLRVVDIHLRKEQRVGRQEVVRALDMARRRADGEPLQYLLGSQPFCELDFLVTPDVLIPRRETELLVSVAVEYGRREASPTIADIGTGSGCIAVTLARRLPGSRLYATDISGAALRVARRNAARLARLSSIVFVEGDLLQPFHARGAFSVIVANPPYIAEPEFSKLQSEVQHEPRVALYGGADGKDSYRALLPAAALSLKSGGLLAVEVGKDQAEDVVRLAEETGNYYNIRTLRDEASIERVVLALRR